MARKFAGMVTDHKPLKDVGQELNPITLYPSVGIENYDMQLLSLNKSITLANQLRTAYIEAESLGAESIQKSTLTSLQKLLATETSRMGLEDFLNYDLDSGLGIESGIGGFFKTVWEKIKEFFAWVWDKITSIFKSKGKGLSDISGKLKDKQKTVEKADEDLSKIYHYFKDKKVKLVTQEELDDFMSGDSITLDDVLTAQDSAFTNSNIVGIKSGSKSDVGNAIKEKMSGEVNNSGYLLIPKDTPIQRVLSRNEYTIMVKSAFLQSLGVDNFNVNAVSQALARHMDYVSERLGVVTRSVSENVNDRVNNLKKTLDEVDKLILEDGKLTPIVDFKKEYAEDFLKYLRKDVFISSSRDGNIWVFGNGGISNEMNIGTYAEVEGDGKFSVWNKNTFKTNNSSEATGTLLDINQFFKSIAGINKTIDSVKSVLNEGRKTKLLLQDILFKCEYTLYPDEHAGKYIAIHDGPESTPVDIAIKILAYAYNNPQMAFDRSHFDNLIATGVLTTEDVDKNKFLSDLDKGVIDRTLTNFEQAVQDYNSSIQKLPVNKLRGRLSVSPTDHQVENIRLLKSFYLNDLPDVLNGMSQTNAKILGALSDYISNLTNQILVIEEKVVAILTTGREDLIKNIKFEK